MVAVDERCGGEHKLLPDAPALLSIHGITLPLSLRQHTLSTLFDILHENLLSFSWTLDAAFVTRGPQLLVTAHFLGEQY